jgi:hypothetical protein
MVLVGRTAELDLFRALLRDLVAGRGRSVLIEVSPASASRSWWRPGSAARARWTAW